MRINEETGLKRCPDCGQDKPASEFWRAPRRLDGLMNRCKPCATRRVNQWRNRAGGARGRHLAAIEYHRKQISGHEAAIAGLADGQDAGAGPDRPAPAGKEET